MKTSSAVLLFTTALLCAGAAAVASPSLQIDLAAPGKAISRDLVGDTKELRQKMREEVLATNTDHFHAFGGHLAKALQSGRICVLGGDTLEKTAREDGGWECVKLM